MSKAILNYTTTIDAWKTVSEIQQILAEHGATHISITSEYSYPVALVFTIDHNGIPLNFSLPCNYKGVLARLQQKKISRSLQTEQQALRVGWRIVKDWVEAQMAMVHAECAAVEEVFMPYLVISSQGDTLYSKFNKENFKLLK